MYKDFSTETAEKFYGRYQKTKTRLGFVESCWNEPVYRRQKLSRIELEIIWGCMDKAYDEAAIQIHGEYAYLNKF